MTYSGGYVDDQGRFMALLSPRAKILRIFDHVTRQGGVVSPVSLTRARSKSVLGSCSVVGVVGLKRGVSVSFACKWHKESQRRRALKVKVALALSTCFVFSPLEHFSQKCASAFCVQYRMAAETQGVFRQTNIAPPPPPCLIFCVSVGVFWTELQLETAGILTFWLGSLRKRQSVCLVLFVVADWILRCAFCDPRLKTKTS